MTIANAKIDVATDFIGTLMFFMWYASFLTYLRGPTHMLLKFSLLRFHVLSVTFFNKMHGRSTWKKQEVIQKSCIQTSSCLCSACADTSTHTKKEINQLFLWDYQNIWWHISCAIFSRKTKKHHHLKKKKKGL